MVEKRCSACGATKAAAAFAKNRTRKDGLGSECKACAAARDEKWRQDNPEKLEAGRKAHYQAHREKQRAKAKAWYHANKERAQKQAMAWRAANREKLKAKKRLDKTGFTEEILQKALRAQGNACAICGRDLASLPPKQVHADHCHATGAPRGVLCHHCNVALGYFGDSEKALRAAISYLRTPPLGAQP